jgi:hypothetical protein
MPFNELFGGQVLLPADLTYLALTISADVELVWPLEQQVGGNLVVADIMDLTAGNPGLNVDMPDARLVSPGTSVLFNNVGAQTVTVRDQAGGTIISLASGTTWMIYLRDNQTEPGLWRTFQFGASVSVANAAALAGAGLKAIGATLNTRVPVSTKSVNYAVVDSDRAVALVWTSGVGQFDLPSAAGVGADWYCIVRNSGNGDLTVVPPSGTIDGAASATFPAGSSAFVVCDGANYFTVGFGTGSSGGGSGFDFLVINVPGSGDYTLSGAELGRVGYRFTGVLTGTRNIIVPGSTDEYWVDNQTTGAFSLFVKTAAQVPGIEIPQGDRKILYCDGTNVVAAESSTVSFPIPVNQGGTGAVTAASARTNLGSGAVGDALFIAANQAAAQTALGIALTAANIWTNYQTVSSADPAWEINETDGAANNRLWSIRAVGEQLRFTVWNDARNSAVDFITVDRTLNVIDSISIAATALSITGAVTTPNTSVREVGYKGVPQNSQSGNYTAVLADANTELFHPNGAGAGDTFTIPSNAAVPYPIGTVLFFTNRDPNALSIAITSDTMILAGNGSTGTRSLVSNGWAYARKEESTVWIISGMGLS